MRSRNLVLVLAALALIVALAACGSAGQSSSDQGSSDQGQAPKEKASKEKAPKEQPQEQEPPEKMTDEAKEKQVAPKTGKEEAQGGKNRVEPPKKKRLKLTVPAMKRIENDPIPTGLGTDENLFRNFAGVHLKASGFPWEETANVYIAGHRIGFPGTRSNRAFYDLEGLKDGDKIYLEDAEGRKYTYEVFEKLIVEPTNLTVISAIPGKNIISLQTCTLPDYSLRVIYRAELKDIEGDES